jgi:hypothetical protein
MVVDILMMIMTMSIEVTCVFDDDDNIYLHAQLSHGREIHSQQNGIIKRGLQHVRKVLNFVLNFSRGWYSIIIVHVIDMPARTMPPAMRHSCVTAGKSIAAK